MKFSLLLKKTFSFFMAQNPQQCQTRKIKFPYYFTHSCGVSEIIVSYIR